VVRDFGDGAADWYGNADNFSQGASDPFGAGSAGNGTLSVAASFLVDTLQHPQLTLGIVVQGEQPSAGLTANYKRGSLFSTSQGGGMLTGLTAYLDGFGGAAGSQEIRMALYKDDGGVPGALIVESDMMRIPAGTLPSYFSFPTPCVTIEPGSYWIVILSGDTGGVVRNYGSTTGTNWYGNANTFSSGASDSFGAGTSGAGSLTVSATYYRGDATASYFGRTSVAAAASAGLQANFKRGAGFTIANVLASTDLATLTGLSAYLDGNGGASGAQSLRMSVYQDQNGHPGGKVAESNIITMPAGTPPGWVGFSVPYAPLFGGSSYS